MYFFKNRVFKIFFTILLLSGILLNSQTGPNSPTNRSNNTSIGVNAWANPTRINSNNGSYATVATKGITNYVQAASFGFAISIPSAINGIVLEIDRSTTASSVVTVLDNWTTGMSKTVSAGVSRCLIACVFTENGLGAREVVTLTYGGQSMTLVSKINVGTSGAFSNNVEYWRLDEAGIAAAVGTAFIVTFNGVSLFENWESISSASFQFVDQASPVSAVASTTVFGSTNPVTLSPAIATREGGLTASAAFCGNNTTPASAINATGTYIINSGFTEVIDTYSANASFSGSGGCFQLANKVTAATGTEGPTYTFNGTPNRTAILAIHIQRSREADHSVRLMQNGVITGSDYAQTTNFWPLADAYATYGGPTDLWGITWSEGFINANNFGAVLSATVQNGTAQVDHMRITVYSSSTLPVELLDFSCESKDGKNILLWQTASESNNKQFIIERSSDEAVFEEIGEVAGHGNSRVFNNYSFTDEKPLRGNIYYRLKQVDFDGSFTYSKIIVIIEKNNEDFAVYPNPSASGKFSLASNQFLAEGIAVYDSGFKLIKTVCNDKKPEFSIEDLPEGTYYLVYTVAGEQKIKQVQKSSRGF